MEVIKSGKSKQIKITCRTCECIYVIWPSEIIVIRATGLECCKCPECGDYDRLPGSLPDKKPEPSQEVVFIEKRKTFFDFIFNRKRCVAISPNGATFIGVFKKYIYRDGKRIAIMDDGIERNREIDTTYCEFKIEDHD